MLELLNSTLGGFLLGSLLTVVGLKVHSWLWGKCCPPECCDDAEGCCDPAADDTPAPVQVKEPEPPAPAPKKRTYTKKSKKTE